MVSINPNQKNAMFLNAKIKNVNEGTKEAAKTDSVNKISENASNKYDSMKSRNINNDTQLADVSDYDDIGVIDRNKIKDLLSSTKKPLTPVDDAEVQTAKDGDSGTSGFELVNKDKVKDVLNNTHSDIRKPLTPVDDSEVQAGTDGDVDTSASGVSNKDNIRDLLSNAKKPLTPADGAEAQWDT